MHLRREIIWYTVVGIVGAVLDFMVFRFLIRSEVSVMPAQWLAAFVGASHNHLFHHYLIFSHNRKLSATFLPSIFLALAVLFISAPLLVLVHMVIHHLFVSKVLVMGGTTFFLFVVRRQWIFTNASGTQQKK